MEQDLVICRTLVAIFREQRLATRFAFRGGTALYKLHLPGSRYSEDIDLVQTVAELIGPSISALRGALDGWLGEPRRSVSEGRVTLVYRFRSEDEPSIPLRLKVEINTREHASLYGVEARHFEVQSPWFTGATDVPTYPLDELMGTKLRALYQRKKGRDLSDLWEALRSGKVDEGRVVRAFEWYMTAEGRGVSRAEMEENLSLKARDDRFLNDIVPLLAPMVIWEPKAAMEMVMNRLVPLLAGAPWNR